MQVVVVNDGGGSIFGLLEHGEARFAEVHERFFATPQDVDVAALCRGPRRRPPAGDATEAELRRGAGRLGRRQPRSSSAVDRGRARALAAAVTAAARAAAVDAGPVGAGPGALGARRVRDRSCRGR